MSVTATLHIYSGMPDPTWELTDDQADELAARIAAIANTTLLKPPGVAGGLGYRGFSVKSVRERHLDPHIYLHAGIVDLSRFDINRAAPDPSLEAWLLGTAGTALSRETHDYVQSELARHQINLAPAPAPLLFAPMAVPPYDPGKWNNDPQIRLKNNCYNYANDKITGTFAQPGRGGGQVLTALDCPSVTAAAVRDGQISVANAAGTPAQGHFIALVIWPGQDYHWYRLDGNAMWSHKPGQTPARNTDNSGRQINDPRTCDRGPYSSFCGFFHCVPANTKII